jgi:hypothetical protein
MNDKRLVNGKEGFHALGTHQRLDTHDEEDGVFVLPEIGPARGGGLGKGGPQERLVTEGSLKQLSLEEAMT